MALLVAPYNPAMRLGMGFNSFTQQLCINDAVTQSQSSPDPPETKQRPRYKEGLMTAEDGSENVSQSVTWSAKFVDRISEVTDSMNVSGSLQIKCDAIGGGGGASASFIDSNKFKESDINYFIQVKVTNQQLIAPDLTDFCPIDGVSPAEFTRVYGDSFISGFIEGGEFNALVSIKLKDRSTAKDISGQLKVQLDLKGASVEGEAQAGVKKENKNIEGETTISVSWTGGGDIKGASVDDWTLETLKAVALEFPEHVMACPMRTSAILTKYTGLKSFQVYMNKMGSPLDYENAGVYSSALLDAYMDYKVMWRNISQAAWELEHGQSMLERRTDIPQFADLARQAKAHYDDELDRYHKQLMLESGDAADDAASSASVVVVAPRPRAAPPARPNELVPYSADIFGLDKARRDCRFEMIKIVKEVDAVAGDPGIATDADRIWQYLSPSIFRMLLPTVKNLGKEQAMKEAAEQAVQAAAAHSKATESLNNDLVETKRKLGAAEGALRELRPYDYVPPVGLNTPVKFRSACTGKAFDFNVAVGNLFQQWDSGPNNGCQKFKIVKANSLGYHIMHFDTGRYVAANSTSATSDGGTHMVVRENFGSVFVFENAGDGTVLIRLADQPHYTVVVEGARRENGAQLLLWPKGKGINDKWYLDAWQ